MKVKVIKEFHTKFGYGQLESFPYQCAFGISIRWLKCKGMGWMIRIYFGFIKFWFSFNKRKRKDDEIKKEN